MIGVVREGARWKHDEVPWMDQQTVGPVWRMARVRLEGYKTSTHSAQHFADHDSFQLTSAGIVASAFSNDASNLVAI